MNYTEIRPCIELARIVECYWFLTGDGTVRQPRRVVPDGRTEIILNSGRPFAQLTPQGWRVQRKNFFAGQITGPLWLRPNGPFDLVGIRLTPAGARSLFRNPLSEMTNQMMPLDMKLSRATLDHDLTRQIIRPPDPRVEAAVVHLIATAGSASIDDLAGAVGWSVRHLQRRFLEDVGLSPRVFARMQRFQMVFKAFEETRNWAQAAIECGYFDQGHLIRDFRELAGAAPTMLSGLAEMFLQHKSVSHFSRTGGSRSH